MTPARRIAVFVVTLFAIALTAAPANASVTLSTPSLAVNEYAEFSGAVATFTTDASATAGEYTASINWGDGTTSSATIAGGVGTFSVSGNHIYADGGAWPLKVTVTHEAIESSATGTATVADASLTATGPSGLTVAEGGAVATTLAHFTDADTGPVPPPSHYIATISWGDGSSSPASITGLGGGEGYDVTASPHVFAEEGSYDLVVSITDAGGAQATVTIPVNVLDLPLAATPVSALSVSGLGSASFSGRVASFTDADPGNQAGDYTAQILWGDGAASQGTVAVASTGVYAVTGAHAYAQSGTYSVTALVRDSGGQSVVAQTSLIATVEHIIVCVAAATTGVRFPCGPPLSHCLVPNLKGKSLSAATAALTAAHCKLGKVTKPRQPKPGRGKHAKPVGPLVVASQSPAAGVQEPLGTAVSVRLVLAPKHKTKRHK
jgi:hypothetical protein